MLYQCALHECIHVNKQEYGAQLTFDSLVVSPGLGLDKGTWPESRYHGCEHLTFDSLFVSPGLAKEPGLRAIFHGLNISCFGSLFLSP